MLDRQTALTAERPMGYDLLHNPRLNKGTAFTEAERRALGLEGLLPPAVLPMELQVARRHDEIAPRADSRRHHCRARPQVKLH
jgi:malate dehydrogenase (oxaloacetate-decarboxylating)(NADP+)